MKIFTGFLGGVILGYLIGAGVITIDINVNDNELEEAVERVQDTANDVVEKAQELKLEMR